MCDQCPDDSDAVEEARWALQTAWEEVARKEDVRIWRQERRSLSKDGVVVVVTTVDRKNGRPTGAPLAVASGFVDESETPRLFEELGIALAKGLEGYDGPSGDQDELKSKVREIARGFIANATRRSPMIIPVVLDV